MTQDTAKIRQFLNLYFNDEELEDLCFDYFREVSRNFTVNMTKKQKIRLLLEYCDKYKKFPHLLTALEKERSTYYLETFPAQVTVDSTPHDNLSTPPVMLNEVREVKHPDGPGIGDSSPPQTTAQNDMVSPPPVMLTLSNAKGEHPDGPGIGDSSPPQTTAQNDRGWMGWLTRLQTVPMPVWGVVAVAVLLLAWAAYSGLNGNNPPATPTTEVAQNSPAATQPVPPSATPTITLTATNLPPTSTATATHTPVPTSSATPTASRTPPPPSATPEPTATPDPNAPPPNAQLGDTWTRPTDGMVMVYVPAGTFLMGSTDGDPDANDDEKPQHEVTLDGFWIDRTEVTNNQFATFAEETGYETTAETEGNGYVFAGSSWELIEGANWQHPQGPTSDLTGLGNHPVVLVSWYDADAYCEWTGGSLPTEAQWEYAARGNDSYIYPWGDEFDNTLLNFCDESCPFDWRDETVNDGYEFTSPVGGYPDGQSWVGAVDMAGNVWEWVADWYNESYYNTSPTENPEGPPETGSTYKVLRGGSRVSYQPGLRAASRFNVTPAYGLNLFGFRCLLRPGN